MMKSKTMRTMDTADVAQVVSDVDRDHGNDGSAGRDNKN